MDNIRERNGKFQARIYLNGQAKAKTFATKKEAERWLTTHQLTKIVSSDSGAQSLGDLTIADIADSYTKSYEKTRVLNRDKAWQLAKLKEELGGVKLAHMTESKLQEYLTEFATGRHPSTVMHRFTQFSQIWRRAKDFNKLDIDRDMPMRVYTALKNEGLVSSSDQRDRRPTPDELDDLLSYWETSLTNMPMADMMMFSIYSCVRQSELVGLRRSDWSDSNRPQILIRDRKDTDKLKKKAVSSQRYNTAIPLLGEANAILRRQPIDPANPDLFFPYRAKAVGVQFALSCAAVGIKDLRWHDLRHEGISRLFENGWTIPQVARVSGHRNWANLQRYTQLRAHDLHDLPYR